MAHQVRLAPSFQNIGDISLEIQDQIGLILKQLEADPEFKPSSDDYLLQQNDAKGEYYCRHLNDWGDWQLTWFYEYKRSPYERTVEGILVTLICQPLELQNIQPKTKTKKPPGS